MKDNYKWMIKLPGVDFQEITPDYEKLTFEDALYKEKFFRRNLKVDLTLNDSDFDLVWAVEKANDPCLTLPIKIQIFETLTSQYVDKWEGYISLKKGEYDLNRCKAIFNVDTSDIYDCIIDGEKEVIDLLSIENTYTVDTIVGEVEFEDVQYTLESHNGFNTVFEPQLSSVDGWNVTSRELKIFKSGSNSNPVFIYVVYETYSRQFIEQPTQPYDGWINVGGDKWVNGVPTRLVKKSQVNGNNGTLSYVFEYLIIDFEADNGILIVDVLPLLINCGPTIISNFFDINSDGTAPDNLAYQYATDYLQNLHVFQASDIIKASASENATKFEVKKGEFLNDIIDFFDLEFYYDADEDAFRLEHVSYRKALRGADLTVDRLPDIKKSYKYKYDIDEIPLRQLYKFKYDTGSELFDEASIEYDATCSNGSDDSIRLKNIVTNISSLYNNSNYEDSIDNLLSAVFLSVESGAIQVSNGVLNYALAFKPIIEALHVFNKPLSVGLLNGMEQTFQSTKPTKLQEIEISIMQHQYFDHYNPHKEFKTQLGWGSVKSSQYEPSTKKLKINLLH